MKSLIHIVALLLFLCGIAQAAIEEVEFQNVEQQERYQYLIEVMRCPMCLNANLAGSDAPIAADLRTEIHAQILDGKSNDEIIDFMKARYGDFIMYRPPFNGTTVLLWFGPPLLLVLGFFVAWRLLRQQKQNTTDAALSAEESAHLRELLHDEDIPRS
jgi:cytochrome c-type biogenesis protein CcmH